MVVSLPPHLASAFWDSDWGCWWPSPTLGEVVTLEPQGPVVLSQSLVLPTQLQPWLWCLGIDIAGQSCKGGLVLSLSPQHPAVHGASALRMQWLPQQPRPQCSTVPLALLVEARRRSSCSRSRSLVQMDSSRRWRRLRISTKCSSSRSAPATAKEMAQGRDGCATYLMPSPLSCAVPEPYPTAILVLGLLHLPPHPARMPLCSPAWTLPVSFWPEGYPDGKAP